MGKLPPARVPGARRHDARAGAAKSRPGRGCASASASTATSRSRGDYGVYGERMKYELVGDPVDGLRGLLPDRRGLHRLRATHRHAGRPGARLVGGQPRGLRPRHHRRRPDRVRHPLRALPQPRAHLDAGHRRRLLHARARRGDPLRRREVRRHREADARGDARRADHHLRDAPGAGRRCATSAACSACPTPTSTASRSWCPKRSASRSRRRISSRPSCARASRRTGRSRGCSRPRASSRG